MSSWLQWSAACLVLASVCLTGTRGSCRSDFTAYRGKCFRVLDSRVTWDEAQRRCERLGSGVKLASVRDMAEFHFLRRFLSNQRSRFGGTSSWTVAWLAANDFSREGDFRWTGTRLRVDARMWAPNQPDDFQGNEDCVGMFINRDNNYLNDQNCDWSQPMICQQWQ